MPQESAETLASWQQAFFEHIEKDMKKFVRDLDGNYGVGPWPTVEKDGKSIINVHLRNRTIKITVEAY